MTKRSSKSKLPRPSRNQVDISVKKNNRLRAKNPAKFFDQKNRVALKQQEAVRERVAKKILAIFKRNRLENDMGTKIERI